MTFQADQDEWTPRKVMLPSAIRSPADLTESDPNPRPMQADPFKMSILEQQTPTGIQLPVMEPAAPWWTLMTPDPSPMAWHYAAPLAPAPPAWLPTTAPPPGSAATVPQAAALPLPEHDAVGTVGEGAAAAKLVIPKEVVWEVCRPFFDQIVESLYSKVLAAQLGQMEAHKDSAQHGQGQCQGLARELREALQKHMPQGPLLAAIRTTHQEQGPAALRWSFLRKHRRDIFRMKCESVQEEVLQPTRTASKGAASSPSMSPSITSGSPSPAQQLPDGFIPGIPLNSSPALYGVERLGGSRDTVCKQLSSTSSGTSEKADVVCCHWKKKGWCKFHSGMVPGRVCKFAHPPHKQGIGREAAMKKLSASAEVQVAPCPVGAFQQPPSSSGRGLKMPTAREPVRLDRLV